MSSLLMLSDEQLIEAYEQAVILKLDDLFIELLKQELDRRKINLDGKETE